MVFYGKKTTKIREKCQKLIQIPKSTKNELKNGPKRLVLAVFEHFGAFRVPKVPTNALNKHIFFLPT
jgi:hypothetical protein